MLDNLDQQQKSLQLSSQQDKPKIAQTFQPLFSQNINENNAFSQQSKSIKKIRIKKIVIISIGVLISIGIILGGLAIGGVLSGKKDDSLSSNDNNVQIQIPSNYEKYEEKIQNGQQQNVLKIIHVPLTQVFYKYILENEQKTITGQKQTKIEITKTSHKIGLLCADVTDSEFDMYLYFISTEKEQNGQKSILTGFPDILKKELKQIIENEDNKKDVQNKDVEKNNNNNNRILQKDGLVVSTSNLENQYGDLNEKEMFILASKNISVQEYQKSHYPIIRFKVSKQGQINEVYQPINLRHDIYQIYQNLIDQLSPILKADVYKVQNGKNRVLQERKTQYTFRNLNGEIVKPDLEAIVDSGDGTKGTLKQSQEVQQKDENSDRADNYAQKCEIVNGGIQKCITESFFVMNEKPKSESQSDLPLFDRIEQRSKITIEFLGQENNVKEEDFNQIKKYQQIMTTLKINKSEAYKQQRKLQELENLYNLEKIQKINLEVEKQTKTYDFTTKKQKLKQERFRKLIQVNEDDDEDIDIDDDEDEYRDEDRDEDSDEDEVQKYRNLQKKGKSNSKNNNNQKNNGQKNNGQKNNGQKNNSQKNNNQKNNNQKKDPNNNQQKDKNDQKDDKNNQKDDINDQKNDKNDEQNDENEKIKDKKDEQNDENVQQKDEQNEKDDKQIENNNDQKEKLIGETIDKPIYRKTIGTFEFGADLKSQCLESKIISEEDICTVGIYGYFNGKQTKIYERKTKINISQLLKYYQYIQHNFVKKSQSLKEKIEQNIQTVMTAFNRVLDKSEEMIDVQKNPILKEIYKTLDNDELGIIKLLNTFESLINTTLKNVNKLIEDPLNTIKERTFSFLSDKKIHIQDTVTSLYNYFKNKFMTIKNFIETNITIGIPQKIKDQINFFMNNYEQIIYQLLEQPLTKLMNETKQLILKKTNEIFNRTLEIDKIANMNAEQLIQDGLSQLKNKISKTTIQMQEEVQKYVKIPNQFKKRLTGKFLMDMMQKLIKQVIQKISQNIDFTKLLKQTLQKGLSVMQVSVQELLNKIPTNNDNNNLKDIQILFQENDEIVSLTVDLFSGFSEFKQEVIKLVNTLKKLQQGSMLKSISQFAQKIVGFPTEIAKQLKQQGIQMIDKIKNLGIRIKENIIQWKDGIVNTSKQLVLEVKNIYKEIKQFLVKPNFPKSSDDYYKTPLFDEAKEIIQKVKESINLNFDPITTTLDRMKGIPDLFLKFIQQIKDMGKLTTKYWDQIKLSVGNIKQEGNSLWKMIQSKANQVNQKFNSILSKEVSFRFLSRKHILDKNGVLDKEYRILYGKEIIDTIQNNILVGDSLDEQLKNLNLNNQLVSVEDAALDLSQNGINQVLDSLSQFKSKTSSENQNIDSLYSDLIKQLLDYFTYEKQVKIPAYRYPIDYSYTYVTSVGIGIKIMLRAEWQLDYDLGIKFKQAILTLSAGLSTRVTVSGQIAIDVGFTEVGGAADGVLFDTGLTVGLTLEPLNKFKGSIYLDGQFTPYYFKIGAYKGKIDLKEQQNCLDKKKGKENEKENDKGQGKKRMLDGENKEIIDVKSTISDILEDNAQPQKPIVIDTGANECKIDIYGLPQRDWILGPLEFKGETYKKRFLEFKW